MHEVVVEVHRRNRSEQTGRSCDQRLGDPRRHDGEVRRAGRADVLKRDDDADHRSEQADERRDAGGRGQYRPRGARAC